MPERPRIARISRIFCSSGRVGYRRQILNAGILISDPPGNGRLPSASLPQPKGTTADSADPQELTTKNAESAERKHILLVRFIALCSLRSLWLKSILCSLRPLRLILRPRKFADFKLGGAKIDQHPMLQPGGLEVAQELRLVLRR